MSLESTKCHNRAFSAPDLESEPSIQLVGLSFDEMKEIVQSIGEPAFRAKQLYQWVYQKGVSDWSLMTNLPEKMRALLAERYSVTRPEVTQHQKSVDGTQKWLLKMSDGQEIEAVYIPESSRGTLCVSSQVGCTLSCKFCHTGTQGLVRNLGAREIVLQVMQALDVLEGWPIGTGKAKELTNIVFMGMGEPLYNYDEVIKAVRILIDEQGLNFSRRKITISTSGVVPMIEQLGKDVNTGLAISLHAVTDEVRDYLVPLNKKYKIDALLQACKDYPNVSTMRPITFEYVMLKDVNDSDADAFQLVKLLKKLPSKVNLIPFNPWPGAAFECSSQNRIKAFARILEKAGFESPVRRARGQDILAACGQLKSESTRARLKELQNAKKQA